MARIKDKHIFTLFILYMLSNLLMLLNTNGLYWDDWVLYSQPFKVIETMFNQVTGKAHLYEYIHQALSHIGNGIYPYRLATVALYYLSGLFLYWVLLSIRFISKQLAFYITLFFLILPVNAARVALIDMPYGVFLCVFFLAFWLLSNYLKNRSNVFLRLTILALFYLSFTINSLVVFYAVVLLYLLYQNQDECSPKASIPRQIWQMAIQYGDFVAAPLLFFFIKRTYFEPYGLYENYNALSWDYFIHHIVLNFILSVKTAFYDPLAQSIFISLRFPLVFAVISAFVFFLLFRKGIVLDSWGLKKSGGDVVLPPREILFEAPVIPLMRFGLLFFVLAVFPYIAVGKIPSLLRLDSRHQLLVPLGLSLCLCSVVLVIERINNRVGHAVLVLLIASCIVKNTYDQATYLRDWFYQIALEEHYKENPLIKSNHTFIVQSDLPLAEHRSMQFYEHNGRLRKVFGSDDRFMGDNLNEIKTYANYNAYPQYNFSHWNMSRPILVQIQQTSNVSSSLFLNLLFDMLHNGIVFRHDAKKLLRLNLSL